VTRHFATMDRNLGILLARQGKRTEALANLQEARKILADLCVNPSAAADPVFYQLALTQACAHLGLVQAESGQRDEALRSWQEALDLAAKLPAVSINDKEVQETLALVHLRRGDLRRDQGQVAEARAAWQQGRDILEQLLRDDPTNPRLRRERTEVQTRLAERGSASRR
jgi:tetratricopeptide (TPR) repeat protein